MFWLLCSSPEHVLSAQVDGYHRYLSQLHSLIPSLQVQGTCKQQIAPPPLSYPAQDKMCTNFEAITVGYLYCQAHSSPPPPPPKKIKNTEKIPFQKESSQSFNHHFEVQAGLIHTMEFFSLMYIIYIYIKDVQNTQVQPTKNLPNLPKFALHLDSRSRYEKHTHKKNTNSPPPFVGFGHI